jgi:hypothetical protein
VCYVEIIGRTSLIGIGAVMERRWGNRLLLNERVRVTRDRLVLGFGCLYEVSLSGAFLKAAWPLRPMMRVCVLLPDRTGESTVRLEAYVVRQEKDGVGLEWCDFAPPVIARIMEANRRPSGIRADRPRASR